MTVRDLEPKSLWNHFADLNAVPRPSKKEERVIQFMMDFGAQLGLETIKDQIGNIIIKKPGQGKLAHAPAVILQSHLDMVHQKNNATQFDFNSQGIEMLVDGDWVKAKGTTLGADNGIGVATMMAVLSDKEMSHPPIEALFTIDEETGMTGAKQLEANYLSGKTLLNLDTEDDDELSIGCAGGIDTNTSYTYQTEALEENSVGVQIEIKGLLGGHSGMDIDKNRGNANKWATRLLYQLKSLCDFQLVSFHGGSLRNAIPREATLVLAVKKDEFAELKTKASTIANEILAENKTIENLAKIEFKEFELNPDNECVLIDELNKILNALYSVPNGVYRMSPDIPGLVEASSSLAKITLEAGRFETQSLQRSSVDSSKDDVANAVRAAFENMGAAVVQTGDYPGWQPNADSRVLKIMADLYRNKFKEEPQIKACHAGLECGILGQHLPDVDMISFGPNIRGAHSPDERVQISSVQKYWSFFVDTLQALN